VPAPAITLRQLYYFTQLAAEGNFRRAAERAGVTQPSLSAQIQLMEAHLGHKLVERGAVAILTPAGREILARAQTILAEAHGLAEAVQADPDGLSGTIRFGATPTTGPYLMPSVVKRLHRDHPELRLHIREGLPDDLIRDLAIGKHDVALAQLPVPDTGLYVRRLFREPLMLAMANDDPLARHDAIDPDLLNGRALLALAPHYRLSHQIQALSDAVGAVVLSDYEGTSLDAIRQMAGMGMGLALLPALYLRSEVREEDDITVRPLSRRMLYRELALVWRASAGRAPAFGRLSEIIVETAGNIGL